MLKWLNDPHVRFRAAVGLFILSLILWPLSIFTFASDEPPAVLSLSWLAITFTALDIMATSDVRKEQDGTDK